MDDSQAWEGDFEELVDRADTLADDSAECDRTFASRQEAFLAGRYVERNRQQTLPTTPPR